MRNILILIFVSLFISQAFSQKYPQLSGDLIIFHAGSLSVPLKEVAAEFKKLHPQVNIMMESAGSVASARKITDLKKPCDIMASADYAVIDKMLIPAFADWNIKFANNELCVVYSEKHFKKPGLYKKYTSKDVSYIRPKETDLLALLETNTIDYIFLYRSVAIQHQLKYLILPDAINLKSMSFASEYATAKVEINGSKPGEKQTMTGEPMVYSFTILREAPNKQVAIAFAEFLLRKDKGQAIMARNGQPSVVPMKVANFEKVPAQLKPFVKR